MRRSDNCAAACTDSVDNATARAYTGEPEQPLSHNIDTCAELQGVALRADCRISDTGPSGDAGGGAICVP